MLRADVDGQHVDAVREMQVVVGHRTHVQQPRAAWTLRIERRRPQQSMQRRRRRARAERVTITTLLIPALLLLLVSRLAPHRLAFLFLPPSLPPPATGLSEELLPLASLCQSLHDPFAGVEAAVVVAAVAGDGGGLVGREAAKLVEGGVHRRQGGMGGGEGGALAKQGVEGGDELMAGSARPWRPDDERHALGTVATGGGGRGSSTADGRGCGGGRRHRRSAAAMRLHEQGWATRRHRRTVVTQGVRVGLDEEVYIV